MRIRHWSGSLVAMMLCAIAMADSAKADDFHLLMSKCSTTAGYLVNSEESLKTVKGTPTLTSCSRTGKKLKCEINFVDGSQPPKSVDYSIHIDSPPTLVFADHNSGDWIMVDTTAHAAVIITRVVGEQFAAAKVCQGMFATQSELELLKKR